MHDLEKNRRGQKTWHRKQNMGQTALSHVKVDSYLITKQEQKVVHKNVSQGCNLRTAHIIWGKH